MEEFLRDRLQFNSILKANLQEAQNRMKQQAHKGKTEREFSVSDLVYLKLQPHR